MSTNEWLEETIAESDLTDEECREAALEWVNGLRQDYGFKPIDDLPRGFRGSSSDCSMSLAIAVVHDGSTPIRARPRYYGDDESGARFARDGKVVKRETPEAVNQFVLRFDAGRYPDLVAGGYDS